MGIFDCKATIFMKSVIVIVVVIVSLMHCSASFLGNSILKTSRHSCGVPFVSKTQLMMDNSLNHLPVSENMTSDCEMDVLAKDGPEKEVRKCHTSTVCMVPPDSAKLVWERLSRARRQLLDPGYYRWPPHANLLYPFIQYSLKGNKLDEDLFLECTEKLANVTANMRPFTVALEELGTFGGQKRGVLWMYPKSYYEDNYDEGDDSNRINDAEPLIELQGRLQDAFPNCSDQRKVAGKYNPHMTLTHCVNLEEAERKKSEIEAWWEPLTFTCTEIYLLRRSGDGGQFEITAKIKLGTSEVESFVPPLPFENMPNTEEEWVHKERMELKKRRNRRGRRGGARRKANSYEAVPEESRNEDGETKELRDVTKNT